MTERSGPERPEAEAIRRLEARIRELEAVEEKHRAFIASIPVGLHMYELFPDGRLVFTDSNPSADRILGVDNRQFIGRTIEEAFPPLAATEIPQRYRDVARTGQPWRSDRVVYKDERIEGAYEVVAFRTSPGRMAASFIDITERKRTEEELRRSEEKYRQLADLLPITVYESDVTGRITFVSQACEEMFGYVQGDFDDGLRFTDLLVPEDRSRAIENIRRIMTGEKSPGFEYRVVDKRGNRIHVLIYSSPIRKNGIPAGLRGILIDITERKQAGEQLEILRTAIESSVAGFALMGMDERLIFVNRAFLDLWGYASPDDVLGKEYGDFWADPRDARVVVKRLLDEGRCVGELHAKRRGGTCFQAQLAASVVRGMGGPPTCLMASFLDVTDRKRLERELQNRERLEALAVMSGGIAHDFNNLLTGILGNVNLALRLLSSRPAEAAPVLREAEKASMRARDLTLQLLNFSRGGKPIKKAADPGALIRECAAFAVRGSRAVLELSIQENLPAVDVDEIQIVQAIQNLVINSVQAMSGGGRIRVGCRVRDVDDRGDPPLPEGRYVEISVSDEGDGIPKDVLPRIFDPYFTTKERGSGLGLATVYTAVKGHGGHVDVRSVPGAGATFLLYLPALRSAPAPVPPAARTRDTPATGRILVMDDEEIVRNVVEGMLDSLGFEAHTVSDGREAAEAWRTAMDSGRPFSAGVLDMTVPGGAGGKEAAERILALDPSAVLLVSSGYTSDPDAFGFRDMGFAGALPKPYTLEQLDESLRTALARRRGASPPTGASPGPS